MATTRAFSGVSFSTVAASDNSPVSLGFEFELTRAGYVTELHFWQPTTGSPSASTRSLAVYEVATGVQVSGTLVAVTPSGSGWQTAALPAPVPLASSVRYRAMCHHPAGQYVAYPSYFAGSGPNASDVTLDDLVIPSAANAVGNLQGSYNYGSSLAMGTGAFNATNYGTDITVDTSAGLLFTGRDNLGLTDTLSVELGPAVPPWSNRATFALPADGTNATSVAPNSPGSATTVKGSAFAPTAGRLLLAVIDGAVTSTTPTGWTLVRSAVNQRGLYLFSRAASGDSGDTFASTHNGSNYPRLLEFFEFPAGTTITASDAVTSGADPTLSGLTGTSDVLFFGSGPRTVTLTWSTGYTLTDYREPNNDGLSHGTALVRSTSSSVTNTASTAAERIAVALAVPGGVDRASTTTDSLGLTDTLVADLAAVRSVSDLMGLTDTLTATLAAARTIADPLGLTDTLKATLAAVRGINDPLGLTDTLTATLAAVRGIADPLGLTDTLTVSRGRERDIQDALGMVDDLVVHLDRVRSLVDPLGLTDHLTVTAERGRQLVDALGMHDTLVVIRLDTNRPRMTNRSVDWVDSRERIAGFTGPTAAAELSGPTASAEFLERG